MLVRVKDEGRVRILTMDRPEQRNALSAALREDLIRCLQAAEADADVGAIVLTGAGRAFAAGADLRELLARDRAAQEEFLAPPNIYSVIQGLTKPVLAAINGHALGAGLELATACDVRIAAPKARLGQPEVHLGLIPGGGGTQRLPRIVGPGQAARLVLTGDPVDAEEALRIGLVDHLAEDPVAAAIEWAAAMARHDPVTVRAGKEALAAALSHDGIGREVALFLDLHSRAEARKRITAFLER